MTGLQWSVKHAWTNYVRLQSSLIINWHRTRINRHLHSQQKRFILAVYSIGMWQLKTEEDWHWPVQSRTKAHYCDSDEVSKFCDLFNLSRALKFTRILHVAHKSESRRQTTTEYEMYNTYIKHYTNVDTDIEMRMQINACKCT